MREVLVAHGFSDDEIRVIVDALEHPHGDLANKEAIS